MNDKRRSLASTLIPSVLVSDGDTEIHGSIIDGKDEVMRPIEMNWLNQSTYVYYGNRQHFSHPEIVNRETHEYFIRMGYVTYSNVTPDLHGGITVHVTPEGYRNSPHHASTTRYMSRHEQELGKAAVRDIAKKEADIVKEKQQEALRARAAARRAGNPQEGFTSPFLIPEPRPAAPAAQPAPLDQAARCHPASGTARTPRASEEDPLARHNRKLFAGDTPGRTRGTNNR
ncbi:hypothetical protein [Streptomyces sp. NPDC000618]|uniref:hypothetical protein n=1 Tax=Streptomyces sp. NPDC000618 TaxID=3154265 RepID=UPI0033346B76